MTEENKDNVVENEEEVNVDDLEPNADPKGGRLNLSVQKPRLDGAVVKQAISEKLGRPGGR